MKLLPKLNEVASVSAYLLILITLVMMVFLWVIFGYMMDIMVGIGNSQIASAFHTSGEKVVTMQWLQYGYNAVLVFTIVVLIIWGIVIALRERSGEVI